MSSDLNRFSVILLGVGNVGSELISQLISTRQFHAERYKVRFVVIALADSFGAVVVKKNGKDKEEFNDNELKEFIQWKKQKKKFQTHPTYGVKENSSELIESYVDSHTPTILIDCSATTTTKESLLSALKKGAGVTMANKIPLSSNQWIFDEMFSSINGNISRLRYESTVGAATPFISCLHRLMHCNDTPTRIIGTFSGTLGYLMSHLELNEPYSIIVKQAYELGYTEPDPRDDLGGVDVARKALILARTMGWKLEFKDIQIEPLYPAELANLSIEDFLIALHILDNDYSEKNTNAQAENKVLRYVAILEKGSIKVGLSAIDKDSPIGRLSGTQNMIEFHTPLNSPAPLVIQGSGAGPTITAAGVIGDMIELAYVLKK